MKNALLLSLALIAVGPVAVEGQQGQEGDEEMVRQLYQARNCFTGQTSRSPNPILFVETCSFSLPGLSFSTRRTRNLGTTRIVGYDLERREINITGERDTSPELPDVGMSSHELEVHIIERGTGNVSVTDVEKCLRVSHTDFGIATIHLETGLILPYPRC